MTLNVTDAIDPGPPQVMDGNAPGFGPGAPVTGASELKTLKQKILTLTHSSTYPTGGYTLTVAQMGGLKAMFAGPSYAGGYVLVPTYNSDGTLTIKLFWRGADNAVLAEVTNGTAVALTQRLIVWGREA